MKMKNLFFTLSIVGSFSYGQIAIGKASVDGSGLLDFSTGTSKGIILPQIEDASTMTAVTPGTLVFDETTSKIMFYNGSWKDLSINSGVSPTLDTGSEFSSNQGVIIGSNTSTANGVLILESSDKALILPKVTDPVANVKSPYAGMMCYDPVKKVIAIFNGSEWNFWGKR